MPSTILIIITAYRLTAPCAFSYDESILLERRLVPA
jgi:hypothetical protein